MTTAIIDEEQGWLTAVRALGGDPYDVAKRMGVTSDELQDYLAGLPASEGAEAAMRAYVITRRGLVLARLKDAIHVMESAS